MELQPTDRLPGLRRWTPDPVPYRELEDAFLELLAEGPSRGASPILVRALDWDNYAEEWADRPPPDLDALVAEAQTIVLPTHWQAQERVRREVEAYAQKQRLAAVEALLVEAVQDGRVQRNVEQLLDEIVEHARGLEQFRKVVRMQAALAEVSRHAIEEARARYLETEPVRLRRATRFGMDEDVHVLEFDGEPWRIPGAFGFGGFNHAPPVVAQIAILRDWYLEFGARLVTLGTGNLGMFVDRPPLTLAARRETAFRHWLYADDGHSGAAWIAAQAGSDVWYFNWE